MRRVTAYTVLGLAIAAFVAAVAWGGAATSSTSAACTPGLKTLRGAKVVVYCGPAKATVKIGAARIRFSNGSCVRGMNRAWAINVGTATVPPKTPRFKHFGITIGKLRGPGRYRNAAIGFQWRGRTYGVTGSVVTVRGTVRSGTFRGRLDKGVRRVVTGSFTC